MWCFVLGRGWVDGDGWVVEAFLCVGGYAGGSPPPCARTYTRTTGKPFAALAFSFDGFPLAGNDKPCYTEGMEATTGEGAEEREYEILVEVRGRMGVWMGVFVYVHPTIDPDQPTNPPMYNTLTPGQG